MIPPHTLAALLLDHHSESTRGQHLLPGAELLRFPTDVAEHLMSEAGAPVPDYAELPMVDWESRVRFQRIHDFNAYFDDTADLHDPERIHTAVTSEHPHCCDELSQILGQAEEAAALFPDEALAEANLGRWLAFGGRRGGDGYWRTWLRMIVQEGEAHLREFHAGTSPPPQPVAATAMSYDASGEDPGRDPGSGSGPVASLIDLLGDRGEDEVEDRLMRFRRVWDRRTLWSVLPRSAAIRLIRSATTSSSLNSPDGSQSLTPEQRNLLALTADLIDLDFYAPELASLPMNGWETGERFPSLCRLADLNRSTDLRAALARLNHARRSPLAALLGEATEALALFPNHHAAEANLAPSLGAGVRDRLTRVRFLAREELA
ncbi:hypothetical protein [Streptacidiphilus fuscans]|uniref:Uncharacterized protein n=1 Tax=Streptacidiphilus fuscans TaxID=2789292 RepID=A0A931B5S4_9ACTN|nr:hypothetical protein [Streptacidiphilus fuscans]MBF9067410.1 hypothetical protein [Streptacidiphilus fuscans]